MWLGNRGKSGKLSSSKLHNFIKVAGIAAQVVATSLFFLMIIV